MLKTRARPRFDDELRVGRLLGRYACRKLRTGRRFCECAQGFRYASRTSGKRCRRNLREQVKEPEYCGAPQKSRRLAESEQESSQCPTAEYRVQRIVHFDRGRANETIEFAREVFERPVTHVEFARPAVSDSVVGVAQPPGVRHLDECDGSGAHSVADRSQRFLRVIGRKMLDHAVRENPIKGALQKWQIPCVAADERSWLTELGGYSSRRQYGSQVGIDPDGALAFSGRCNCPAAPVAADIQEGCSVPRGQAQIRYGISTKILSDRAPVHVAARRGDHSLYHRID